MALTPEAEKTNIPYYSHETVTGMLLAINKGAREQIQNLMDKTENERGRLVQKSLATYDLLTEHVTEGGKVILRFPTADRSSLIDILLRGNGRGMKFSEDGELASMERYSKKSRPSQGGFFYFTKVQLLSSRQPLQFRSLAAPFRACGIFLCILERPAGYLRIVRNRICMIVLMQCAFPSRWYSRT